MDDMAKYCEDIIVMSHSRVAMKGKRNEIFCRGDELEEIGLGVPQITLLMRLLSNSNINISQEIYTVDDDEKALSAMFGGTT